MHTILLLIGAHYTYAEVPLFNWLRDYFDLSRNYYDMLGHFAQGFIPAMIAREVLLRKRVVKEESWLFFIVCCICLSISASYEFIEWWVAVAAGGSAEALSRYTRRCLGYTMGYVHCSSGFSLRTNISEWLP